MNLKRRVLRAAGTAIATASIVAIAVFGPVSMANAATSHESTARVSSSVVAQPITVTFALMAPNAPVSFTVNGAVVGTGITNSNGDVTFTFTPTGLNPGYYRLIASTSFGISSSVGFSVR